MQLPSDGQNPNLPVMFYILGGAFLFGRTNRYGADYLMDEDVVLVLIDFRYGPFGMMKEKVYFTSDLVNPVANPVFL